LAKNRELAWKQLQAIGRTAKLRLMTRQKALDDRKREAVMFLAETVAPIISKLQVVQQNKERENHFAINDEAKHIYMRDLSSLSKQPKMFAPETNTFGAEKWAEMTAAPFLSVIRK
jgi:hypothetical protein